MKPSLTVVTPWLNHRELERDYWAAMRTVGAEVLVIDNGSEPPLPNAWRLDRNTGFSHACNVGLELARTDAVLWLNNDIAAVRADWLEPIRDALEPGVLVGANLRFDQHGSVDGESFPYLDGWCLAGMRDDLLDLGGFDESYAEPAYYSDNDLCLRARAAGMRLREVPVGLVHKLNVTAGHSVAVSEATVANRQRFIERAHELMGAAV
jgi:GT2 family glycosyltransferase